MYVTAAYIVKKYSGMPLQQFVQERIFDPLGMVQSTYSVPQALKSGLLSQSMNSPMANGRTIPYWFSEDNEELNAGAGGVISNAADMVRTSCA